MGRFHTSIIIRPTLGEIELGIAKRMAITGPISREGNNFAMDELDRRAIILPRDTK